MNCIACRVVAVDTHYFMLNLTDHYYAPILQVYRGITKKEIGSQHICGMSSNLSKMTILEEIYLVKILVVSFLKG